MARLRVSARESTESVSRHAGRITARLLTPLLSEPPAVPECKLPPVSSQQAEAECPSLPIAEHRDAVWRMQQHHWLLAVAAVAVIAFVAGWLSGQWHLQRQRGRRRQLVQQSPAPATAAAAEAQAAPDTASLAAAEQAQRRAAGCSADQAAPLAGSHQSDEPASPEHSVAALRPAAADSAAEGIVAESVSSRSDVTAASLAPSPSQREAVSEAQWQEARPAAVQPPAQQASSLTAARQVWRTCNVCLLSVQCVQRPLASGHPGNMCAIVPNCRQAMAQGRGQPSSLQMWQNACRRRRRPQRRLQRTSAQQRRRHLYPQQQLSSSRHSQSLATRLRPRSRGTMLRR